MNAHRSIPRAPTREEKARDSLFTVSKSRPGHQGGCSGSSPLTLNIIYGAQVREN